MLIRALCEIVGCSNHVDNYADLAPNDKESLSILRRWGHTVLICRAIDTFKDGVRLKQLPGSVAHKQIDKNVGPDVLLVQAENKT
ncbi:MAG: hypothetical protein U0797_00755 [Gemmataceae bacterium]